MTVRARQPSQSELPLVTKTWGGKRAGAGRKPRGDKTGIPHRQRPALASRFPIHLTLRMREHVWNLRSRRSFHRVEAALLGVRERPDFRVVHFSIQGNHIHLIVEAHDAAALSSGAKALAVRLALHLNRMMDRHGPVLADRYHAHILRTPREVRNALRYVLGNFSSHAARRGEPVRPGFADPYASATLYDGETGPLVLRCDLIAAPRTWLLSLGWRRGVIGT